MRAYVRSGLILLLAGMGCSSTTSGGSGTGGSGTGGGGGTGMVDCVADCPAAVPQCHTAIACENGQCVYQDAIEGTPVLPDLPGDCLERVCDGMGYSKVVEAPTDVPDDGNFCTLDGCNGSIPVHTLQTGVYLSCYSGPAGTAGAGICQAGMVYCDALGMAAGPCEGEVLPQAEVCDAALTDEDCDGKANEGGANCVCGDGYVSPELGEECDDGATLDGDPCSPACKDQSLLGLSLGEYFTCARLAGNRIKCWGWNAFGGLGLQDTDDRGNAPDEMGAALPFVDLGMGNTAKTIALGAVHVCAVLQDGRVKCWGSNISGQLGLGDEIDRGVAPNEMGDHLPAVDLGAGAVAVGVAAGFGHSCALLQGGTVKCWGGNFYGSLGVGDWLSHGDEPNEMGDNLPAVNLGTGATVTAIATREDHTCALLADGCVKCWGNNMSGELGLGHTQNIGDDYFELGDSLPPVDLGTGKTAKAIAVGSSHSCALLEDGSVKCWGDNWFGQLGLGDTTPRGNKPNDMGDHLLAVDLGTGKTAVALSAGSNHTCAVLNDGSLKCWGWAQAGQLGLEDQQTRGDEANEMGDNLPAVDLGAGKTATAVRAGEDHTCAILNDGSLKCWGSNFYGTLGLGDMYPRGYMPGQMGDALPTVKLFSDLW